MNLIENLRAKGKLESRGEFTLDASKAASKLGRSQLGDPSRFLLELVAGFHAMQLKKVDINWDGATFLIDLSPTVLQLENPGQIANQLLNPGSIYQRIAVGLSAVEAREGVCIWRGSQGEIYSSSSEDDSWTASTQLTTIEIQLAGELAKSAIEHLRLGRSLRPTLDLSVLGAKFEPTHLDWPWGSFIYQYELEPARTIQVSMAPDLGKSSIILCQNGLVYGTELIDFPHPVQAVVEGFPFKLDAAYSQVIRDSQLEAIHQEVQTQFWAQVESYFNQKSEYAARVIHYWSPKLTFTLLTERPYFKTLPHFRSSDGNRFSLQQLLDRQGPVAICTDPSLRVPKENSVVWVDSQAQQKILNKFLDGRLQDQTAAIRQDWERQELHRKFVGRPQIEPVLVLEASDSQEQVLALEPPYQGQIAISSLSSSSRLRVLYKNRQLVDIERETPNPYLAVVNFSELQVNDNYDGLESKAQLDPLFEQLNRLSRALYQRLSERPDKPNEKLRRHLANLLTRPGGLQSWSIFYDTPLYQGLSKLPSSPENEPAQTSTLSLRQIKRHFDEGQRVGFLNIETQIPPEVPFQFLAVDHVLWLRTADHTAVCSFLQVSKDVVPNLEGHLKKVQLRFGVRRECILDQRQAREAFQETEITGYTATGQAIRAQLAILPSFGSTKLELLRSKIACGTRQLELGPLAAIAIIDCPALLPTPDWTNIVDNQAWKSCLERLTQAYQSALAQVVLEFIENPKAERLKAWKEPLTRLILINWPKAKRMCIFPAYPKPVSMADLERCQTRGQQIDYLINNDEPEQCKKLLADSQSSFILFGLPSSEVLASLGELKLRNLANKAQQARLEQRLLKTTITFPAYSGTPFVGTLLQVSGLGTKSLEDSYTANLGYSNGDLRAFLGLGGKSSGRCFLYTRGRLIQHQLDALPNFCDLHLNCDEFEVSTSLTEVLNRELAEPIIQQWPQRLHQLVKNCTVKLSNELLLRILLGQGVLEETFRLLSKQPVWPSMHGMLSLIEIARRLKPEDVAVSYCKVEKLADLPGFFEREQFRGNVDLLRQQPQYQNLSWPTSEQPLVLALNTARQHLNRLPQILNKPLRDVSQSFRAELFRRWKREICISHLEHRPDCFERLELEGIGFLGIPHDCKQNGVILWNKDSSEEVFEELGFNYPLCGVLTRKPDNLNDIIGQLYSNFSQGKFSGPVDNSDAGLQALLAFCLHRIEPLHKHSTELENQPSDTQDWKTCLIRSCWLPAQDNSWVSLLQLRRWSTEGILPKPLPYLAKPGRPEVDLDFPLLVLASPEWMKLVSRWTGRKLQAVVQPDITSRASSFYDKSLETVSKLAVEAGHKLGNLVGPAMRKLDFKVALPPTYYQVTEKVKSAISDVFAPKSNDDEGNLKRALLRESRRLTDGSRDARSRVESQLNSITFVKCLFAPPFWRDYTKCICLNRSHRQIRSLLLNLDSDRAGLMALLILLIAEINLESSEISDEQEIQMLHSLLSSMVDGYPEGFQQGEPVKVEVAGPSPKKAKKRRR